MRHRKTSNRLGRPADQRHAVLRTLATELLRNDEIITTLAKAKALQPEVEKMITKAKQGYLKNYDEVYDRSAGSGEDAEQAAKQIAKAVHLRRQLRAKLYDREVVTRVFDEVAPRYLDRPGGYTRIIKYRHRTGDNAPLAIIQLV